MSKQTNAVKEGPVGRLIFYKKEKYRTALELGTR